MRRSHRLVLLALVLGPGCTEPSPSDGDGTVTGGPTSTGAATDPVQCEGDGSFLAFGGDDSGDPPIGMGDDMPITASVPEIQQGMIARGQSVVLEDVVITTPRVTAEPDRLGDEIFVQDPAGGPWSGLRVLIPSGKTTPDVAISDRVDVIGRVEGNEGYYVVELGSLGSDIVALGPGELPSPLVVAIEDLALDDPDGRAYEGIPVRVEHVIVTDDDPCDGEFVIEDTARVDDRFAAGRLPSPERGAMLTAVEGVVIFANDALEIGPLGPGGVQ